MNKIELVKSHSRNPVTIPSNVIHTPLHPSRRQPDEKGKALLKPTESLLAAVKDLRTASRAMKDLELLKEEEVSTDAVKSIQGNGSRSRSSFSGEKLPWNEYFYNTQTRNSYLKELDALTAEASSSKIQTTPEQNQHHHYEKNKNILPMSVRYPKRIPQSRGPVTPSETSAGHGRDHSSNQLKLRSRSVATRKVVDPPVTSRRSRSIKCANPVGK